MKVRKHSHIINRPQGMCNEMRWKCLLIYLTFFTKTQNHRIAETRKHLCRCNLYAQAESPRAGSPGQCLVLLWMSPMMETLQSLWGTCAILTEKVGLFLWSDEISSISVCVVLSLHATEKSLILTSSLFQHFQVSQPLLVLEILQFLNHFHGHLCSYISMPLL